MTAVGIPVPRVEGVAKVTGAASYSGEISLPGMTYLAVVGATVPCGRVSINFTGRPTYRAAIAVSVTFGHTIALAPNPPPTKCVITRTRAIGRPSSWATVCWVAHMPWVDS